MDIKIFAKTLEQSANEQIERMSNSTEYVNKAIKDTVDVIDILKPVYNFKAK